jgi:hypothetical protein
MQTRLAGAGLVGFFGRLPFQIARAGIQWAQQFGQAGAQSGALVKWGRQFLLSSRMGVRNMKESGTGEGQSASALIDARIAELADWRGRTLSRMRGLIKEAVPAVVEEWKWMGTPVWSYDGIICTGESYKAVVKLTFAKGASLDDPAHLFNSSLDGKVRRAIDIRENEEVGAAAFMELVRRAVAFNSASKSKSLKGTKK